MKRYSLLDAFRGIAIIWIVLLHVLDNHKYWDIVNKIVHYGFLGVEIFFVISGYAIAGALERAIASNQPVFDFFLKRSKRIYITYWFSLVFVALIFPVVTAFISALKSHHLIFEFYQYTLYEWFLIITLAKIFTANSGNLNHAFLPLNGVVWFIAILIQIYFVVSLCLILGRKYKWALLSLFIISLFTFLPKMNTILPYGLFFPYFPDFYIGMIVFYLIKNNLYLKKDRFYIFYMASFLIISVILTKYFLSPFIFSVMVGALCYLLYPLENEMLQFRIIKFFIFIGSFSYSLYLLQISLWQLVAMFTRNLVPLPEHISTPLILIPCVIFLSFIWYLFFEKPGSFRNSYIALKNPIQTLTFWGKNQES